MEENNTRKFSQEDIEEALAVMNSFTQNINDAKRIFASILVKYDRKQLNLDDDTIQDIIIWASNFAMVKERVSAQNKGIKPN